MKFKSHFFKLAMLAFIIGFAGLNIKAQNTTNNTARVQVIHNSADITAQTVDIWLDDVLLLDDFKFRTSSPFIDAPAGQEFTISVKGPDSQNSDNPIWSNKYTLAEGQTYILIANGIVTPEGYDPVIPFDIYVYAMGRELANNAAQTDVLVFHGSTDAPTVDIVETGVGAGTIVDNLMYGNYAGYLELPTSDYVLDIRDQSGQQSVVKYTAPLQSLGLDGSAIVTVASGFLDASKNNNGESFGLWVSLPSGGQLVELPLYQPTAKVQFIHNSIDVAASEVDIWIDGELLLDNFQFHTASPFVEVAAEQEFTVSIKAADSQSPFNPLWTATYSLEDKKNYILIASGLLNQSGYNPFVPFDVYAYDMGREQAMQTGNTDILVFHGSTDAPTVDIYETTSDAAILVDDISYGDFEGYLELPTSDYILELRDQSGESTVASYSAPLESLNLHGSAMVTLASGFFSPENNTNGQSFGLWVALPTGGELIELPAYNPEMAFARVQVIHNSADLAAQTVDVWLDDVLLLDNFMFRTASPFIDAPANQQFTISVAGMDSQSAEDAIWSKEYTLNQDETYVLIANGIVSPEGYNPSQPFDIYVYTMGREQANMMGNTDVLVFHGSTDAPTVDIVETGLGAGTIVDDLMYGEYAGYLELPTNDYRLAIKDETGSVTVAEYDVPLASLGLDDYALSVVASGFLNPAENNNGDSFGLWVALPEGGNLVELSIITSVEEEAFIEEESVITYPNPATDFLNISYSAQTESNVNIDLYSLAGTVVKQINPDRTAASSQNATIDVSDLSTGMYFVRIQSGNSIVTKKIQITN